MSKWQSQHLIQISSLVLPSISCAIACSPKSQGAIIVCFSLRMGLTFFCLCSDTRNLHSLLTLLNYFQHMEDSSEYWLMSVNCKTCHLPNTIYTKTRNTQSPLIHWQWDNGEIFGVVGKKRSWDLSFLTHLGGTQESGPLHNCSGLALISQGRSHSEFFQLHKRSTAKSCFSTKLLGYLGKC